MLPGTVMQQLKIIWWLSKSAFERSWMWWCSLIPGKRSHWFWWNFFLCPMHPKNIKSFLGLSFKFSLINWRTLHVLAVATLPIAPWRYNATVPTRRLHARLLVLFHSKPARLAVVVLICTSITVCYIEWVYDTFLFVIYKHEMVTWICHLHFGN